MKKIVLLFVLIGVANFGLAQSSEGVKVIDKMLRAVKGHNTVSATIWKYERCNGNMVESELKFKVQYEPHKVYLYNMLPSSNEGVEVLYIASKSKEEALVNPNGFPYVNMNLDVGGDQLRKPGSGHHQLTILGFRFFGGLIGHYRNVYSGDFDSHIKYHGKVMAAGKTCHKIELYDANFGFVNYTVKANENVLDIAKKLHVSEVMIVEKNSSIDWFDDVKEGDVITVPTSYAKKVFLFVDVNNNLPIELKAYDDIGLYEHYKHTNLVVNPTFNDDTFSSSNSNYGF